jgi:Raf kinase inhibitor-like YbhB/YbcL family protein
MKLVSPAFAYGEPMPAKYAYCGPGARNLSPPLTWSGAPAATSGYVLLMTDPDAPGGEFVHWVVYDLPATRSALPEGASGGPDLVEGVNGYGALGYGGPCPPPGPPHRYFFRLYALAVPSLDLPPGATLAEVVRAMNGRVLATAEWMGTYRR